MKKGILINIEGTDGAGKATQTNLIYQRLEAEGLPVRQLSFPCYQSRSSELIKMYLGGEFGEDPSKVNPYAASVFYAVDRFASYQTDWGEFYQNGGIIITDRYTNSNAIHQGSKLPANDRKPYLDWLYETEYERMGLPRPDLVIYLNMPVEISTKLREEREARTHTSADIHEKDFEYLKRCHAAALQTALREDWKIITCAACGQVRKPKLINQDIYIWVKKIIESARTDD